MSRAQTMSWKSNVTLFLVTVVAAGLLVTLWATLRAGAQQTQQLPKPSFDEDGNMIRPDVSYREWVYVGTPFTPNELNPPEAPFPEFHNVYIHPEFITDRFVEKSGEIMSLWIVQVRSERNVEYRCHGPEEDSARSWRHEL